VPQFPIGTYLIEKLDPLFSGEEKTTSVVLAPNQSFAAGTVLGQITSAAVSAVQTLTLTSATGGTFTLSYNGQTTAPIPYNATAAQVQAALALISTIGNGQVVCAGGPLPGTAVTITFAGLMANLPIAAITVTSSLTGGGAAAAIASSTTGVANGKYTKYAYANTDGSQVPKLLLVWACSTDDRGNVYFNDSAPNGGFAPEFSMQAYYRGVFAAAQIPNLDANCMVADGGPFQLIAGSSISDPNAQVTFR
jgi:hypothetical protein